MNSVGEEPWKTPSAVLRACQIIRSFRHFLQSEICSDLKGYSLPGDEDAAKPTAEAIEAARRLFHAPVVVLSHDGGADPVFVYANARALHLWEMEWGQLVGMQSKYSAPPEQRNDRAGMLAEARRTGFITGYSGVRVSRTGRLFRIADCALFAVRAGDPAAAAAASVGQAAVFERAEQLE
jgi:hypothetical protein